MWFTDSSADWTLPSGLNKWLRSIASCSGRVCSYLTPVNNRPYTALVFDISRPQSRAERIARIEWLSTLLDTALVVPGTNIRFGLGALIGLEPGAPRLLVSIQHRLGKRSKRRPALSDKDE
jgi:hypothetical protein